MKAGLLKILSVIAAVVLTIVCVAVVAGGMFLVWAGGCAEAHMVYYTCQFLP